MKILARMIVAGMTSLVFVLCGGLAGAQANHDSLAFARAQHLKRGINLNGWFAQADEPRDYSPRKLETEITADDVALVARMGFDHVRLPIDPEQVAQWQETGTETTPYMTELDRAVKLILDNHLSVIIDVHPFDFSYTVQLRQGSTNGPAPGGGVARLNYLWRALAARYASTDPEHVFFAILDEPFQEDTYHWQGIQTVVAHTIRRVAPRHTIIATGDRLAWVDDLLAIEPIDLPNVIYTFQYYEDLAFTHQGATWGSPFRRYMHDIPYPSSPEAVASKLDQLPDLADKLYLERYGLDRWNAERLAVSIGYAAKWSQLHNVPVYCSEFGVLRAYANPTMRNQWLHDVRVEFEKNEIGWAMWDYQTSFGLVTKENGVTNPDAGVLEALGLHIPNH